MAEEGKIHYVLLIDKMNIQLIEKKQNQLNVYQLYIVCDVMRCFFFFFFHKADAHLDEYNEMFEFIVKWTDRARSLVKANIIWNSSSHLQEQIRIYQVNHNTHTNLMCV